MSSFLSLARVNQSLPHLQISEFWSLRWRFDCTVNCWWHKTNSCLCLITCWCAWFCCNHSATCATASCCWCTFSHNGRDSTSDPILFLQNTYCCVQESLLIGTAAGIPYWVLLPLLVLLKLFLMNPHTHEAAMMSTNQIQLDGGHARWVWFTD
jgi:hypothetical protein